MRHRAALRVLVVAALVLTTFAAGAQESIRPSGRLAPASGALFGSFQAPPNGAMAEPDTKWDSASLIAATEAREADLGRVQDVAHWLYAWGLESSWPGWREEHNAAKGRISMVSWGGTDTREINAGTHDRTITSQAERVKAFGAPLFLRWFWEMDATENADRARDATEFVAAWRRIHDSFTKAGATNAVWVWCPTAWGFNDGSAPEYYPGDAYVDWVCADGFNWYPGRDGSKWQSFEWIYRPFYDWAMAKGTKPLMAATYGVQEDPAKPGRKALWFQRARQILKTSMTGMAAVLYYDTAREHDWRVDTSDSS